jgi:hypothetical protein
MSVAMCPIRPGGYSAVMPLMDRVRRFLASPQGRKLTDQGRRAAADPRNRARARDLFSRLRRR